MVLITLILAVLIGLVASAATQPVTPSNAYVCVHTDKTFSSGTRRCHTVARVTECIAPRISDAGILTQPAHWGPPTEDQRCTGPDKPF